MLGTPGDDGNHDGGVAQGGVLIEFAERVLDRDDAALHRARERVHAAVGADGLVDAAAVVGLFDAIDRVADATGIPLEPQKAEASADFRAALGIDAFAAERG